MAIIVGHRVLQGTPWQFQLFRQSTDSIALGSQGEIVLLESKAAALVRNQPGLAVLVIGDRVAQHTVIGLLRDKTLARAVHQNA